MTAYTPVQWYMPPDRVLHASVEPFKRWRDNVGTYFVAANPVSLNRDYYDIRKMVLTLAMGRFAANRFFFSPWHMHVEATAALNYLEAKSVFMGTPTTNGTEFITALNKTFG